MALTRCRWGRWLLLAACLAMLVALRLPFVGHLLQWDEAMNLCAVRAFAGGGSDPFSAWFWHHPPLLNLVLLAFHPLQAGFAERGHLLFVLVAALNLIVLYLLNRQVLGERAALWSCFFLAAMPGPVFYDLWLKQDPFVILFGLLALLLLVRRSVMLSGAALGLALLSKETAVFYAFALGVVRLMQGRRGAFRDLLVVFGIAAAVSAWWYAGFSISSRYLADFALGRDTGTDVYIWRKEWDYFIRRLPLYVGYAGLILCVPGLATVVTHLRREKRGAIETSERLRMAWLWPVLLVVPALAIFSASPGKAHWFLIPLLPGFATLAGMGAEAATVWIAQRAGMGGRCRRGVARAAASALIVGIVWSAAWGRDFEAMWQERDAAQLWGSRASRQAAEMLNRVVKDGQRIMITPMTIWRRLASGPCPILAYYLRDIPLVLRTTDIPLDYLVSDVREYKLSWVLYGGDPESGYRDLVGPLVRTWRTPILFLEGACLIDVSGLADAADSGTPAAIPD